MTSSVALSAKILEGKTHFGAEAHSVRSLAVRLFEHPAFALKARERRSLTAEDREFLGEILAEKLPTKNYFKKAFELPGLRLKVFACLEELRMAGYEPSDLQEPEFQNQEKLVSLRGVFELYLQALKDNQVLDYPMILSEVIDRLRKDANVQAIIARTDLILPFEIDLAGMESSFLEVLREKMAVYEPESRARGFAGETRPESRSLAVFKRALEAFIDRKPIKAEAARAKLDSSLELHASLTAEQALAQVFDWLSRREARLDTAAIVSPGYDAYAGQLYRHCLARGIDLNLARGILASEFAFFAEDLARLSELRQELEYRISDSSKARAYQDESIERVRGYFVPRQCDEPGYEAFKGAALQFIASYCDAQVRFPLESVPRSHFWKFLLETLLSVRISSQALGLNAQGLFYGAPEDLVGVQIENLAILGLQDHHYPPKVQPDAILTDDERALLNEGVERKKNVHELRLSAPTSLQKDLLEKISLGVRKSLFLEFQSHDLNDGDLSLPSSFLNRVLNAFGYEQKTESLYELSGLPETFIPRKGGNPHLDYDLYLASQGETTDRARRWQERLKRQREALANAEDGIVMEPYDPSLLSGEYSASTIAGFFKCPYAFYLQKVIGLKEIETSDPGRLRWLDAMQRGTFLHRVFELLTLDYLKGRPGKKPWADFLESKASKLVAEKIAETERGEEFTGLRQGIPAQVIEGEKTELIETSQAFIRRELEQVEETGYYPLYAEQEFEGLPYVVGKGGERIELRFKGTMDRLDGHESGRYRVIDYKTGSNKFKDASNLFVNKDKEPHFQHAIYGLWALGRKELGVDPSKLTAGYYYCTDKGGWAFVEGQYPDFEAPFEKAMRAFHASLGRGEFRKNPEACARCRFRLVCAGIPGQRKNWVEPHPQIQELQATLIPEGVAKGEGEGEGE